MEAEWRKLVLINYCVEPSLLEKYIPKHTELDLWNGQCYVSLVGFLFQNTKVKGCKSPGHINFEEVNLRFYVKRIVNGETRRGVVFIKEIVPKALISFVARKFYGEPYVSMPMVHKISTGEFTEVFYEWFSPKRNSIHVMAKNTPKKIEIGSEEEFITEHYWGYTKLKNGTAEYEVTHPRWEVYPILLTKPEINFEEVYGNDLAFLSQSIPAQFSWLRGLQLG